MGFLSSFCIRWYQKQSWIKKLKVRFTHRSCCERPIAVTVGRCGARGGRGEVTKSLDRSTLDACFRWDTKACGQSQGC